MAKVVTIPREISQKEDLVVMPRSDYEEFLQLKKIIPLVKMTPREKQALQAGRKEIKQGKYFTLKQLKNELEG